MLGSCSKQYHFERFIDKGGKIEPKIEWKTVTKTDTIKGKDGMDSIIYCVDSIPFAVYETKYIPKWRIRFDNNRFEDSLKHIRAIYKDSLKHAVKTQKIEVKSKKIEKRAPFWFFSLVFCCIVGVIIWFLTWMWSR